MNIRQYYIRKNLPRGMRGSYTQSKEYLFTKFYLVAVLGRK